MPNLIIVKEYNFLINKYIESLDDKEKIAINIAKDHLKSSFNLEKSIGFIKFKNNYNLK